MHDSGFIHRDGTCRALINAIKNLWHVFDVVQPILLLAYCFVRLENSLALPVGRYVNNAAKVDDAIDVCFEMFKNMHPNLIYSIALN